ncbi:MAG: outer membrane lipoprotein carrier protein LolA [Prevotellaceae bacterium]|jgi:outer membrane lipoprotein-sorting protein|nr:outer membrane lipoprotein carrier protein LolA [Prevotellaceae bacterium]
MRINKITVVLLLVSFPFFANSQKDLEEVLDELARTIASYKCLYFEYTLKTEDLQLSTSTMQDGKAMMKGNKYRVSTKDIELYNDGTTQWQYLKEDNEVMISLADSTADIVANPLGFILGDKKEFKQKLKGEVNEDGFDLLEIDFYPKDIKMPYSFIRVRIDDSAHKPYSIKYAGKDGVNYTIKIKNYTPDDDIPEDEEFVFDTSKYPDIETVDLRE